MWPVVRRCGHFRLLLYVSCLYGLSWWLLIVLISGIHDAPYEPHRKLPNNDGRAKEQNGKATDVKRIPTTTNLSWKKTNQLIAWNDQSSSARPNPNRTHCPERTNFVYIKQIKCASQTLVGIFRRFGLERGLSFVTPIGKKIYLGWPWPIQDNYYRPPKKNGRFNILCEHAVFDEVSLRKLMPSDVVFITSLRQPFAQFKSMFNYYAFKRILNITSHNPLSEYLRHIEYYDSLYTSHNVSKTRYCVPDGFHMSKNLMSYNLGFPTGFLPGHADMSSNATFVSDYISSLNRTLYFVIIAEYFHESLVMLRRLFCWQIRDIVYLTKNVASYSFKSETDPELEAIYRQWSTVDYRLYDHFNRTFWKRVSEMGTDFWEEVTYFNRVTADVRSFCANILSHKAKPGSFITFHKNKWNEHFVIDKEFCRQLNDELLRRIQYEWDEAEPKLEQPIPDREFC